MSEKFQPPKYEESAEEIKLEWGPNLGQMTWGEAQIKITELNAELQEGEKPWRLPTLDELKTKINKVGSIIDVGHQKDFCFSGTINPKHKDSVYIISQRSGGIANIEKESTSESMVRCVR